jgi:transposase-like protein
MSGKVFGPEEKAKLIQVINEGANVMQEVADLKEGLRDTVKAIAEEMDVKPALINKAIGVAHKGNWQEVYNDFDDLETIVVTVGKDK